MIPELGNWLYTPAERLGGGGYAQAYRCRGVSPAAGDYAIKVFSNPFYANTFEKEVQALQSLAGCAGTPALVDYGRNREGKLCIVTGFEPGVRLERHIRTSGTLSVEQTLLLLEQMLGVLSVAHARGLLHKDVSSFNILMAGGRFVLLDWGVSEPIGSGRAEAIRAKQEFVAPECYHGTHACATDFYALGWLAVQALTGAMPYHFGAIREADYRVAAHCLERPTLTADMPATLRRLVANWLDKDAARRLVGYDLAALQAAAQGHEADFSACLDLRQIQRECGYLHRAARHGIPYAQYHLALRLLKAQQRHAALYWLQEARARGYGPATCQLARELGKGAAADKTRARELLEEAAKAGQATAQYLLAMALLQNKGAARDVDGAVIWLRRAAEGGHARSQYELARLLARELGRPKEAEVYFAMAAERGLSPESHA